MAYLDYASELTGWLPKLPFPLAQRIINRAWSDICDSRLWSFLISETALTAPAIVSTGTANVTQFSASVVGSAAAKAVWDALANPVITQRQFRLSGGGPIYNIRSYDNVTGTITLDRIFQEATNATAQYQIYRCYYTVPSVDFLRWVSVFDPNNGRWLKLNRMKAEIDRRDPTRGATGDALWIASYKTDTNAASNTYQWPVYELWPHPVNAKGYQALYQRRGTAFSASTDALPPQIDDDILLAKARVLAYEWAEANKGRIPELRGSDYRFLMGAAQKDYVDGLNKAAKQDEETFLQNWIVPGDAEAFCGPIDATFAQSHEVVGINA